MECALGVEDDGHALVRGTVINKLVIALERTEARNVRVRVHHARRDGDVGEVYGLAALRDSKVLADLADRRSVYQNFHIRLKNVMDTVKELSAFKQLISGLTMFV